MTVISRHIGPFARSLARSPTHVEQRDTILDDLQENGRFTSVSKLCKE